MQVDGITSLVRVLQEVSDGQPPTQPKGPAVLLPSQVREAAAILQWFVEQTAALSPSARAEALRYDPCEANLMCSNGARCKTQNMYHSEGRASAP